MELTGDGRSSPSGDLNLSRERSNSDPGYRDRIVVMNGGNTVPTRRTPTFLNTSEVASPALGGGANSSTPPPVRRNKLAASIGRLFRPWKWRKRKKSQKFINASENLERQLSVRSKREELVKKGILPVNVKEGTVPESDDDSPEVECNGPSHANNVANESDKEPLPPVSRLPKPRAGIIRPSPIPNPSNLPTENEVKKELQVKQVDRVSMMDQLAQEFARRNIGDSSSNEQTVTRSQNTRHCSTAAEGNKNARFFVVQSAGSENDHSGREDSDSEEETRYYSRHNDSCSDSEEEEDTRGIITGLASKLKRKDSLALKLKVRPSQSELEARNILPTKTEEEKLERKNEVGTKLIRRLSTRPTAQELIERNILKSSSEEEAKEEKEEKKRVLTRKLSKRPTVQELRAKKILKFNDYVEVCDVHDYDRRADKPWTRLTPEDKAAIRKELNEYKSTEMEVHEESKQYTRFHRP